MTIISITEIKSFSVLISRSINSIFRFEFIDLDGEVYSCTSEFSSAKAAKLMADSIIEHELQCKQDNFLE